MSSLTNSARPLSSASSWSSGAIARHGPHQGAQKSTTTGRSDASTSCSKLASVTSRIPGTLAAEAQQRHAPHGLEHDRPAHLRASTRAIGEDDRHLDDPEARLPRAVGRLDLERIAPGGDAIEVDRLEHASREALEAAGRILHAHLQEERRVERGPAGDESPQQAPVAHTAAGDVA